MKSKIRNLFFIVMLCLSCIRAYAQDTINPYQIFVDKIETYQKSVNVNNTDKHISKGSEVIVVKKDDEKNEENFNFNEYFSLFDKLSVEKGWEIDAIYAGSVFDGEPIFIALEEGLGIDAFLNKYKSNYAIRKYITENNYLKHVVVENDEMGFFQFAVLKIVGERFALRWHSGYKEIDIICDKEKLNSIINRKSILDRSDDKFKMKAKNINPIASIEIKDDFTVAKLTTFNRWQGFKVRTINIRNNFPHYILSDEEKLILHYNCGIRF